MHERAEESRHNETTAYLMFLTGAVFFIGAILETLSLGGEPSWFFIIPYYLDMSGGMLLGFGLLLVGVTMIILGIAAGVYYAHERGWYMHELRNANSSEDTKTEFSKITKKK